MFFTHFELGYLTSYNVLIIASGFCSKAFSFFESHDPSVTPGDMNWKSEMKFDQSFSDSMSNCFIGSFSKDLNWLELINYQYKEELPL